MVRFRNKLEQNVTGALFGRYRAAEKHAVAVLFVEQDFEEGTGNKGVFRYPDFSEKIHPAGFELLDTNRFRIELIASLREFIVERSRLNVGAFTAA